ncbi:periplasmic binding protein-like II [Pleomassaria siparia CBS 279.74]|uniref:Periplasmic binding protein-like II n=1 Tax=Pleomassaria siparia CBS 279.74 TaxID=1314801 RepID=A0A6G1KL48_9PLEO|nr:periplasmic binding protein-like II [Pleomassaria siparia CBS 279.74]
MSLVRSLVLSAVAASSALAYSPQFAFAPPAEVETRTLDELHQAALKEGGVVTVWHGGDEPAQQDDTKTAFEARFPGMTLNITVDLSKYHDINLDEQLAKKDVYVDSIILQTLHDYPRWKEEGALLNYKPAGWDQIHDEYKDQDGAYTGVYIISWSNVFNTKYINGTNPVEYSDYLKPEFKDKLVLTYPNDDDAVLFQFQLILNQYGLSWFESLLAQNPRWVRGTATPVTLVASSNGTYSATFTSSVGFAPSDPLNVTFPTTGPFVTWPQTAAILADAPHPESAKLFHNWLLTTEHQTGKWSVRKDVDAPTGFNQVLDTPGTDPTKFSRFMADRAAVERLRFFFENKIGSAQGLTPLGDNL